MDEQSAGKLIVEIGKLMYDKGYVTSSDGNISCRLGENLILATPTQVSKGRMTEDMMALVDLEGNALNDKKMSSEIKMHLLIYNMRPDINAV
ncbi:MAG: class II aldolase/adducin family protein, partial [Pyrinomonadaceae bacterium]